MSKANVTNLFNQAAEDGIISVGTANTLAVFDIGNQIQAGLGANIDEIDANEVILISLLIDDSGSIRFAGNTQKMRDGYNDYIRELREDRQSAKILIHVRYLNGKVLCPFVPIEQAPLMDDTNYNPLGGTPLYDQAVLALGTLVAEMLRFMDNGVPVRSILLLSTDGEDESSYKCSAADVKKAITEVLMSELAVIASAIGFDNGRTDFRAVFNEMGIPEEWILNDNDIRKAFNLASRSAKRASKSAANFGSMGGFGD